MPPKRPLVSRQPVRAQPWDARLARAVLDHDLPDVRNALAHGATPTQRLAGGARHPTDRYVVAGGSLIHFAVVQHETPIALALIAAGAEVRASNAVGGTPLHAAAEWGDRELVTALLTAGADPLARDAKGRTPLHAMMARFAPVVTSRNLARCADLLLTTAPAAGAAQDDDLITPLHLAATRQERGLLTCLLAHGAPVDAVTAMGITPLHCAIRGLLGSDRARAATCTRLLAAGASPNAPDRRTVTPLTGAAQAWLPATVRALVGAGAVFDASILTTGDDSQRAVARRMVRRVILYVERGRLPRTILASILALEDAPLRETALCAVARVPSTGTPPVVGRSAPKSPGAARTR